MTWKVSYRSYYHSIFRIRFYTQVHHRLQTFHRLFLISFGKIILLAFLKIPAFFDQENAFSYFYPSLFGIFGVQDGLVIFFHSFKFYSPTSIYELPEFQESVFCFLNVPFIQILIVFLNFQFVYRIHSIHSLFTF